MILKGEMEKECVIILFYRVCMYQGRSFDLYVTFLFLGPVFVEFPIDVLYNYKLVMREVGVKPSGGGLAQKVVNM